MRKHFLILLALVAALAPVALAGSDPPGHGGMHMGTGRSAPAHLVVNGSYSDKRFIDMMVPHHLMAVEMARMELRRGSRAQVKQLARRVVGSQGREIGEMKSTRKRLYGSGSTTSMMSEHEMQSMGMATPAEMSKARPFDKAFIDSMIPHHSGAIEMASVALARSRDSQLRRLARSIVDAQASEIGQMIAWRLRWYSRS